MWEVRLYKTFFIENLLEECPCTDISRRDGALYRVLGEYIQRFATLTKSRAGVDREGVRALWRFKRCIVHVSNNEEFIVCERDDGCKESPIRTHTERTHR
jgi:hypothetical protein